MNQNRRGDAVSDGLRVASATECTGLMPALPTDEASDESAAALGDVLPAPDRIRD